MAKSQVVQDEAFGIIPIWQSDGMDHFLIIQHHQGHWGFPKGHANRGESPLETARREFVEETGIGDFTILETVCFSERYQFVHKKRRVDKTVVYFPAMVQSPEVQRQEDEIRDYLWAGFDQAIALLTYEGARRILQEVQHYFSQS